MLAGTIGGLAGMTDETVGAVSTGAAASSCASFSPIWYSAHNTGFSLSISAHGIPSIIAGMGPVISAGHRYAAMAILEVRIVISNMQAISRANDEKKVRIK
jgi:hypothetical protein